MKVLIKAAKVIDPNSSFNGKTVDVFIEEGIITNIGESLSEKAEKVIAYKNLHISPGLMDMHADFCEPGLEYKEDLISGANAAAKGGFTAVAIMPNTTPARSSKTDIEFVKSKTQNHIVDVLPIGTLSHHLEGKELAEMFDMKQAGAVAFSDNKKAIKSSGLMSRALLYSKNFDGLVISFANDESLSQGGQMHEGEISTTLGLESIPALSEELQISRDLFLTSYNESKIHFSTISTANSVAMIKEAKSEGINVTCEIAAHQIALTDKLLVDFDSNYKTLPPLREDIDTEALIAGLKDGTIDIIVSDHTPQDIECKQKEFDLAEFGITGLQTAFPLACTHLEKHIGLEGIIQKMAINPRTILQIDVPVIEKNFSANIALFNPTKKWILTKEMLVSKSKNTPFIGTEFTGKVLGIINNDAIDFE
jgi:dihydroorotase